MAVRLLVVLIVLALSSAAEAQQAAKVPRIGYLGSGSSFAAARLYDAFRQGLHEIGYIEGKNIIIEHRYGGDNPDRYPVVAAELVHQGPHVIVAAGGLTAAVKNTTNTIPIVFVNVDDPVASGYVISFARPGGNVTGLSSASGPWVRGKTAGGSQGNFA